MNIEPRIMSQIAELLEPLDAPARARVIGWTVSALDVQVPKPTGLYRGADGEVAAPLSGGSATVEPVRLSAETEEWLTDEQDYTF